MNEATSSSLSGPYLPPSSYTSPANIGARWAEEAPRPLKKVLFRTGIWQWGTKSFEFWTLLMVLLAVVRPKSMVELGSGRSTSYLTEYAMKEGVPFASIEENRFYVVRTKRGLRNSFLTDRYLHHVATGADGWYRPDDLDRAVDFPPELLLVDGPTEFPKRRSRQTKTSSEWLLRASAKCKVVIVDDVHKRWNLEMFEDLVATAGELSPMYLSYSVRSVPVPNVVAIAVESSSADVLARVCSEMGISFLGDYSIDQCTQS